MLETPKRGKRIRRLIQRLNEYGFVFDEKGCLRNYLNRHPELYAKVAEFRFGKPGRAKYGKTALFGFPPHLSPIFYLRDRPERLVEFLEGVFLAKHPNPSRGLQAAFTLLLHHHGLHSSLCYDRE